MGNICIISNNPLTLAKYPAISQKVEGGVYEVYVAARNVIHLGEILINHPLSGSVKPNQNPHRSLIVSSCCAEKGVVDLRSVSLIDSAFEMLRKLPVLNHQYDDRCLYDFQIIDLDLLDAAVKALPAQYHL